MKEFITQKGINLHHHTVIPIKKYKIHNKRIEKARLKKGICSFLAPKEEKKEHMFPKIELQSHRIERKALSRETNRCNSKSLEKKK